MRRWVIGAVLAMPWRISTASLRAVGGSMPWRAKTKISIRAQREAVNFSSRSGRGRSLSSTSLRLSKPIFKGDRLGNFSVGMVRGTVPAKEGFSPLAAKSLRMPRRSGKSAGWNFWVRSWARRNPKTEAFGRASQEPSPLSPKSRLLTLSEENLEPGMS